MSAIMMVLNTPDPAEQEAYTAYAQGSMPLIKAAGGKPTARYTQLETLVGDGLPKTVLAVEFPSAEAIKGVLNSPQYKALTPMRDRAFSSFKISIYEAS